MKFFSDVPDLHIIRQRLVGNRTEHYELCVFDDKGELETEDKEVIRQLINIYRHEEAKVEEVKNEEPKNEEPEIKEVKNEETESEEKIYKCKKCDFETTNKGELAAHYRTVHPKPKK